MSRCTLDTAMSTFLSLTGLSPSLAGFPKTVLLESLNQLCSPNPGMHAHRFALFRFRSPLLTKSHVVFSSSPYLDVSVQAVSLVQLLIHCTMTEVCSVGLLHSEIHGSKRTYRSPWLIAVNHVLRRLPMPRHSPCALISFTICFMLS